MRGPPLPEWSQPSNCLILSTWDFSCLLSLLTRRHSRDQSGSRYRRLHRPLPKARPQGQRYHCVDADGAFSSGMGLTSVLTGRANITARRILAASVGPNADSTALLACDNGPLRNSSVT